MFIVRFNGHKMKYHTDTIMNEEVFRLYQFRYVRGHVEVFDQTGTFLFSADNMREANEILEE